MKQKYPPGYYTVDLHDGRIGIYKNGICVKVMHSLEEAFKWLLDRDNRDHRPKINLVESVKRMR